MAKVKLNFRGLPIPEKLVRAQQIITAMTGNANFTSPHPALAQVTTATNDLDAAYAAALAARQEARTLTNVVNTEEYAFDGLFSQLASYVESVSGGDEAKIQSSGMDIRSQGTNLGELSPPEALNASQGDHQGEIDLQWDKVERARSYVIERSTDPVTDTSWQHAAVSTRSSVTVEDLTSATKYWFRVAAVGSNSQSGWSNPATRIAP